MKVLILNRSDSVGGAGLAATSIFNSLNSYTKADTYFLCKIKKTLNPKIDILEAKNFGQKIYNKIVKTINYYTISQDYFFPISNNIFTHKFLKDVDIINIHNIHYDYFSYKLIEKLSKIAPIVLTMQDMWYLTGHCAYSYDCDKWKYGCKPCNHLDWYYEMVFDTASFHWKRKKAIYNKSNITCVSCSNWLLDFVNESPLLKDKSKHHIFNPISTDVLKPRDKNKIREMLELPMKKNIICFGASDISDERKGFPALLKSLDKKFIESNKIFFIIIGGDSRNTIAKIPEFIKYKYYGSLDNPEIRSYFYNSADLFIFPTLADNLPNMLIESLSCGIPCVTFDTGGCKEIIINDKTGYLARINDFDDFKFGISKMLKNKQALKNMSLVSRNFALKNFSEKVCAEKYYNLFENILNNKNR